MGFEVNWANWTKGQDTSQSLPTLYFTLSYDSAKSIEDQFPERSTAGEGILVCADSQISYFSSMNPSSLDNESTDGGHDHSNIRYYRDVVNSASLSYNAYQNNYGSQKYGWSQLGINPLDPDGGYFQVQSAALYDVHDVKSTANQLKLTFELYRKNDAGTGYTEVQESLGEYLKNLKVKAKVLDNGNTFTPMQSVDNGTVTFRGISINKNLPIEIEVDMQVLTGEDFEGARLKYANYKLELTAELLDNNGNHISGSSAHDYIIYTNAKIRTDLVS